MIKSYDLNSSKVLSSFNLFVFLAIIIFALFLRLYHIDADPPIDPGQGQSLSTDPPQYIHYAANKVSFGSWDNWSRTNYVWHHHNLYAPIAFLIFSAFGPGLIQGNIIAVLFAVISICLLFWILRDRIGNKYALIGMFLLTINYEFIMVSRLSYLENIQILTLLISYGLIDRFEKWKFAPLFSGIAISVGVFYCKLTSIFSVFGIVIAFLIYLKYIKIYPLKKCLMLCAQFAVGFCIVGISWIYLAYLPTIRLTWDGTISASYFTEFRALQSLKLFIFYLYSVFIKSRFVLHEFIQSFLTFTFLFLVGWKMLKNFRKISLQELLWFLGIILIFVSIFGWEWRPIRYQTVFAPMMAASSAWVIYYLGEAKLPNKYKWHYIAICIWGIALFSIYIFSIIGCYTLRANLIDGDFWGILMISIFTSLVCTIMLFFILVYKKTNNRLMSDSKAEILNSFIIIIIIGSLILNASLYYRWCNKPMFTIKDSARAMAYVLNKDAYLIGTYAPLLSINARIRSDSPIWGTDKIPNLLEKYPATHIVQEVNGPLLKLLNEEYSGIRDSSLLLGHLYVRGFYLELWKLSIPGNHRGGSYSLSPFEKAMTLIRRGQVNDAREILISLKSELGTSLIWAEAMEKTNIIQ